MLKKTISYVDYDGVPRTEEFYFNLSKSELIELSHSGGGGLDEQLKAIVAARDNAAIIRKFKEIILLGYGVRSEDGRRFIKNPQLTEEFSQTAAFEELFIELATNGQAGIDFINGLVPADLAEAVAKLSQEELAKAATQPPGLDRGSSQDDPHKGMLSQPRWPKPQDHLRKQETKKTPLAGPISDKDEINQQIESPDKVKEEDGFIRRPPHESGQQDSGPNMINPYGV